MISNCRFLCRLFLPTGRLPLPDAPFTGVALSAYLLPPDVRPSLLLVFVRLCHADFSLLLAVRRSFGISGFEEADGIRRSC